MAEHAPTDFNVPPLVPACPCAVRALPWDAELSVRPDELLSVALARAGSRHAQSRLIPALHALRRRTRN